MQVLRPTIGCVILNRHPGNYAVWFAHVVAQERRTAKSLKKMAGCQNKMQLWRHLNSLELPKLNPR
jgi:hypothetical protein